MKKLISLTQRQTDFIEKEAKRLQISKSELIRRILDEYLNEKSDSRTE